VVDDAAGHIVHARRFFGMMVAMLLGAVDDSGERIVDAGVFLVVLSGG